MLATIPLLGKSSDLALLDIIGYHNQVQIPLNKVDIGLPTVVSGRRTRSCISSKPSTPYRINNYIESMYFTYNRLNLTEVFLRYVFQGINLQPPVTTKMIVDLFKSEKIIRLTPIGNDTVEIADGILNGDVRVFPGLDNIKVDKYSDLNW